MLRWRIVLALALVAPASRTSRMMADPFVLVVTTWMGAPRIPASMKRRKSSDGKLHACMYPNGALICIYVPPSQ